MSGRRVGFRLLRGKDEKDIVRWRTKELEKNPDQVGDPAFMYQMAKHVVTVDGVPPENFGATMDFFEGLIAGDVSAFASAIEDYTSGISTALEATCPQCREVFVTNLAFTVEFFRTQRPRS